MDAAYKFELVKAWWMRNTYASMTRTLREEVVEAIYKGKHHPFIFTGNGSKIATTNPYDGRKRPKTLFRYEEALFSL